MRDANHPDMARFLPLYQALDPLFPIGAFTLSGGLETYVQKNIVRDRETLSGFLRAYLGVLPYNDLGMASLASDSAGNAGDIVALDHLCGAAKSPVEIRNGSVRLCSRLIKTLLAMSAYENIRAYREMVASGACAGHYPVAIGLFIADLQVDKTAALNLYCYSMLSTMVNHAVKLVPLGQLEGQAALFETVGMVPGAVEKAVAVGFDDLGVSGCGLDLRAMQHEKLYSRMYMS